MAIHYTVVQLADGVSRGTADASDASGYRVVSDSVSAPLLTLVVLTLQLILVTLVRISDASEDQAVWSNQGSKLFSTVGTKWPSKAGSFGAAT